MIGAYPTPSPYLQSPCFHGDRDFSTHVLERAGVIRKVVSRKELHG